MPEVTFPSPIFRPISGILSVSVRLVQTPKRPLLRPGRRRSPRRNQPNIDCYLMTFWFFRRMPLPCHPPLSFPLFGVNPLRGVAIFSVNCAFVRRGEIVFLTRARAPFWPVHSFAHCFRAVGVCRVRMVSVSFSAASLVLDLFFALFIQTLLLFFHSSWKKSVASSRPFVFHGSRISFPVSRPMGFWIFVFCLVLPIASESQGLR